MPDTLVIGLGGAGATVCRRLLERIIPAFDSPVPAFGRGVRPPDVLVLDTDRGTGQVFGDRSLVLTANTAVLDAAYRTPERFHAEWIDRRILRGRGSLEQGTRGQRMLGRFLFLLPENRGAVRERIGKWLNNRPDKEAPARVYVVAGAFGGTGGGALVDLGYLLQDAAAQAGAGLDARGILFVPPPGDAQTSPNSFATLTELHYFADPFTRYRAHLDDSDTPFETRRAPYSRVSLLTSVTPEGGTLPLVELQERASVYLLTATMADDGHWEKERGQREGQIHAVDTDGNPQVFSTFGTEWVEYPEDRLVSAVYRNLVRRSLVPWLSGDHPVSVADMRPDLPMTDPEALAARMVPVRPGDEPPEAIYRPVKTRLPWIHKAPAHQWNVMDQELTAQLTEATGIPPSPGRPGKGPVAEKYRALREEALAGFRQRARDRMCQENTSLERVARALNEAAAELRTQVDPVAQWDGARQAGEMARRRVLWCGAAVRKDPFLFFWRRVALQKLALDYDRIARLYIFSHFQASTLPYLKELREFLLEPVRTWAGRIGEAGALFAKLSRAWADHESAMLERLRKDEEEHRLALGMLRLPGAETPYVANSGWNLPYCRPEDEKAAIRDLRAGWIQLLVDREDGILALPGRSVLDGTAAETREDRLPWLMPSSYSALPEAATAQMRQVVSLIDRELRTRLEDRLRTWLSATAFQRLAEQHRDPIQLEFELRRMVNVSSELPALEPPHARPAGLPPEYQLIFFSDLKTGQVPSALNMVVDGANQEHPTCLVPSRSPHYLTAVTEHAGFALSRCPAYHHLEEVYREWYRRLDAEVPLPFSRADVPWLSATLVTGERMRAASDVLLLALALGILHSGPDGQIPLPGNIIAPEPREPRFPLPGEFDLAVRQLAGDTAALAAVAQAVDRAVQGRGASWCSLQVERALRGELTLPVTFPGTNPLLQHRSLRLAAQRAVSRYEDLLEEFAGTPTARDSQWLAVGPRHYCPACAQDLGESAEALPGFCPSCREPLLLHKAHNVAASDGFRRIPNPFVVGTPLETGTNVFVGREDIVQQIRDRLIRPAQRTILILIGERRCGKTSALRQLKNQQLGDLHPLFIDMQGLTATDLPGFVWWLAWRMKDALDERGVQVELPTWEQFSSNPPDYQFETVILPEVRRKLQGGRVLLMLDEFEVLAQRVINGTFDSRAFDYIRHLMQHGEGIEFLFAGTHVLRQFAANYVTFLFNIGVFLGVDFLRPQDALRLVQEPVQAAGVTYTEEALASILELGGAHPYFSQMFGFHLVERLNRLRKRNVTRDDVEEEAGPVIAAAGAHLDHVWGQLGGADRLLISFFTDFCPRGKWAREDELLAAAIRDDSTLRPFIFRTAVEKLMAVGLLRARQENTDDGRQVRTLALTAEVYRQWLQTSHGYSRLREEGVTWE